MKKIIIYCFFISSSFLLASCSGKEETDNAQLEADISPVIPKVNSTVVQVKVEDNQIVKEGDTLVILDDANYKIAVAQAEIALEQAKQNVSLTKTNSKTAEVSVSAANANSSAVSANISSADAGIEAARTKVWLATKNYERFETLLLQKSASQQQFDVAQAEKEAAEAQLRIAQSQANSLTQQVNATKYQVATGQSQVNSSLEGISLAELAVKQAEQNLIAARLLLSYCVITAPSNGVVSKKNVQKGQVVGIGQPLMAIADNQKIWIVANFKETQIEKMKVDQPVDIYVDAYSDKMFKGKVGSFSQATGSKFSLLPADNATGNFVKVTQRVPVKILFTETLSSQYPLRAGMSVLVKVKTN
jgi:membrane fusion protein, multidrug efflux system